MTLRNLSKHKAKNNENGMLILKDWPAIFIFFNFFQRIDHAIRID
jgi:hypothetical protein